MSTRGPDAAPAPRPDDDQPDDAVEEVVLLDEDGHAVGTAAKAGVHHSRTPLHLAFSCYLFSADGQLLVTRRATHKRTWPGVWTNSVCGHPGPGEDLAEAVRRRAEQELGTTVRDLRLVLPSFRYRATMEDGTVENELCPVFTAVVTEAVRADPAEVGDVQWVDWVDFRDDVLAGRREVSPWCSLQVARLAEVEVRTGVFSEASADLLPPAAVPRR